MIFVNVYEKESGDHGDYYSYRFYSGESEREIKRMIIDHISDLWDGAGVDEDDEDGDGDSVNKVAEAFNSISDSLSFNEVERRINDIMEEIFDRDERLEEYELIIGDPTSDISYGLDFYDEYRIKDDSINKSYGGVDFYFYGDYAIRVKDLFPYFYDLMKDYDVIVGSRYFSSVVDKIIL